MLKIGLTGGIGSGKSTVCHLFAELGVPIVDADVVARQLVEPGLPALVRLGKAFGAEIINQDGSLNRAMLRQIAFADAWHKQQLDAIMHPLIHNEIQAQVAGLQCSYCILAIPLLLEAKQSYQLDRVLVVDCPEPMQIQRVMHRDKVNQAQAEAIMAVQTSRRLRLAAADDVIDTTCNPAHLAEQVKSLHNSYLLLATARTTSA